MVENQILPQEKFPPTVDEEIGETTEISWTAPEGLEYDKWTNIGCTLQTVNRSMRWWLGDWLNHGEATYGETYAQAILVTDSALETLKKYKAIAERVRKEDRLPGLSWTHHFCVAYLPQQEHHELLQLAFFVGLPSRDFQQVCKLPDDERKQLVDIFMNIDEPDEHYALTRAALETVREFGTIYLPEEDDEDNADGQDQDGESEGSVEHEVVVDDKEYRYNTDAGADVLDFWSDKGVPVLFGNEKVTEWKGIRVMAVADEDGNPLLLWDMIGVE